MVYSIGVDAIDSGGAGDDVVEFEKEYLCEAYGMNCGMGFEQAATGELAFVGVSSLLVGLVRGARR
jgi:hypothetical protein